MTFKKDTGIFIAMYKYFLYWENDSFEDNVSKTTEYWDILETDTSKTSMLKSNYKNYKLIWIDSCDGDHEGLTTKEYTVESDKIKYLKRISNNDYFLMRL